MEPRDGDEVAVRRARIGRWASLAQRTGYGLLAVAVAAFAVGAATEFSPAVVGVVVGAMALGSLVLAPAIIVSYGVKAAAREDR